jgi:hypothetical protein
MSRRTAIYLTLGFVLGILCWALEAAHYREYLDLAALFRASLWTTLGGWGLLLLGGWAWWYRLELASWQRGQRAFLLGLVALLLVPPFFSATNRWGTAREAVATEVIFDQEVARYQSRFGGADVSASSRKPHQYFLFFYWQEQLCRIAYEEGPKFANQSRGARIALPLSTGRWGFSWIPTDLL